MGRPTSKGIGYFPLDTEWEREMKLVRAKFKSRGVGVVVELWQHIYHEGPYLPWDEETELLFAGEIGEEIELVREVVAYCMEKDIFDRQVYETHQVLTSHGIQKRYYRIVVKELKRVDVPYVEGITYPDFMPKKQAGGNGSNLGESPGGNPDNPPRKPELPPEESTQNKQQQNIIKQTEQQQEEEPPSASEFSGLIRAAVGASRLKFRFDGATIQECATALFRSGAPPGYPQFVVSRIEAADAKNHVASPKSFFRDVAMNPGKYRWLDDCRSASKTSLPARARASPPKKCPNCRGPVISADDLAGCRPCGIYWHYDRSRNEWIQEEPVAAEG